MTRMPAIHLAASPGRRLQVIELAKEVERRGFAGVYCATAGAGDCVGLCQAIAQATNTIAQQFDKDLPVVFLMSSVEGCSDASLDGDDREE